MVPGMNVPGEMIFYLKKGAGELGLSLSPRQVDLFIEYYRLLLEYNEKANLTGITAQKDVALKHFVDSLCCSIVEDFSGFKAVVDVGSGAGFPGLPLKIAYPQIQLFLLDSQKKRIEFLRKVVRALSLVGVEIFHERAENFGADRGNRERYDICVSRAVAPLGTLAELCLPLVKVGGNFLALKGPDVEDEVNKAGNAVDILGGEIRCIQKFNLPVSGDGRSIVVIEKSAPTPARYPRKPGIPAKRPL